VHHETKLVVKAEPRAPLRVWSIGSRRQLYGSAVHRTYYFHFFLEEALSASENLRPVGWRASTFGPNHRRPILECISAAGH